MQLEAPKEQAQRFLPTQSNNDWSRKPDKVFHVGTISCVPLCQNISFSLVGRQGGRQIISSAKTLQPRVKLGTKASLQIICFSSAKIPQLRSSRLAETWTKIWEQLRSWHFKEQEPWGPSWNLFTSSINLWFAVDDEFSRRSFTECLEKETWAKRQENSD